MLSWMAWTWPTAAFFVFIACCLAAMIVWEKLSPGYAPRDGIFGLRTTRGDRMFISLLGTAYIFLGWLAFYGAPLWGGLALAVLWFVFVFRYV